MTMGNNLLSMQKKTLFLFPKHLTNGSFRGFLWQYTMVAQEQRMRHYDLVFPQSSLPCLETNAIIIFLYRTWELG